MSQWRESRDPFYLIGWIRQRQRQQWHSHSFHRYPSQRASHIAIYNYDYSICLHVCLAILFTTLVYLLSHIQYRFQPIKFFFAHIISIYTYQKPPSKRARWLSECVYIIFVYLYPTIIDRLFLFFPPIIYFIHSFFFLHIISLYSLNTHSHTLLYQKKNIYIKRNGGLFSLYFFLFYRYFSSSSSNLLDYFVISS